MIIIKNVVACDDFILKVLFSDGVEKTVDFKPFLSKNIFTKLKDIQIFKKAFVQCGTVCWDDETDIPAEHLYYNPSIEITSLIAKAGGQTAFAREHGIPLRTVQNWAKGKRRPPNWLVKILYRLQKENSQNK
jgi:hypothetical protein